MRIEKNLHPILESKQPNSKPKKTHLGWIKTWVSSSRLTIRQKFNENELSFSTFLSVLPIALGFSQFLAYHLNSKKNHFFFQTNFPAIQSFQPKLNGETHEYLWKSNVSLCQRVFEDKKLESSFSVPSNTSFLFGQPRFLTKIKKLPLSKVLLTNQKFNSVSLDFFMLPSGNFLSETSATRSFDELPSYLKSLNQNYTFQKPLKALSYKENSATKTTSALFVTSENKTKPNTKSERIQKQKNQAYSVFVNKNGKVVLSSKQSFEDMPFLFTKKGNCYINREGQLFTDSLPSLGKMNLVNQSSRNLIPKFIPQNYTPLKNLTNTKNEVTLNQFSKYRLDFYKKLSQLNTELENLFIEQTISYFSTSFEEPNEFGFVQDTLLSEKLLQDFENKKLDPEGLPVRPMSGYVNPDAKRTDLQWYSLFYKNSQLCKLKKQIVQFKKTRGPFFFTEKRKDMPFSVNKPRPNSFLAPTNRLQTQGVPSDSSSLSFSDIYPFSLKGLPKILIQTKNILLRNREHKQEIYAGPLLVLDLQKNLDWKTSGDESLRSWFHEYLSPANPLLHFHDNFFGNYFSPEYGLLEKNVSDFVTNSFLRLKLTKTPETKWMISDWVYASDSTESLFAPSISSLHIVSGPSKSRPLFQSGRGVSLSLQKKEGEHFFPLIELKQPWFLFSGEKWEKGYSSLFDFGSKGSPDSNFFSVSLENAVTNLASGQYRKLPSVFSGTQSSSSIFVTNWEPLTSSSWLVISQLSFAVFLFSVLKGLADNYGRELLGYLLDLVTALGILDDSLKQQIEILTGQRNQGFRIVSQSSKTFNDIVGIQKLLLEIYEVVLFLRNAARDFTLSTTLPHGILLTGPPGTGKTLLVQAIAGEAQVPVIVLSGSSLIEPGESGAFKLQLVFQEARNLAPCIVFIDEIDTFSAKRTQIMQNPMATDPGFEDVLESVILESKSEFEKTTGASDSILNFKNSSIENGEQKQHEKISSYSNSDQKQKQLSLLSQLLIELDGVQGRDGVVVIGATNRPEILDPALLRPGRFEKVVQVGLPDYHKRLDILKFYGERLGFSKNLPWNYLGERTAGFTAADLSTLMNESTIKAILNKTTHTIETIEHGIDRLTTCENEKFTLLKTTLLKKQGFFGTTVTPNTKEADLAVSSKMSILRLAYHQAGKILLSYVLQTHPKSVVVSLWPRRPTIRSLQIATNLQNSIFDFARLCEITDRLIGCYAGKAAEFLFLQKFSSKALSKQSTLGLDDIVFAQKLVYFLLEKCRFYSKKTHTQGILKMEPNINMQEFRKHPEKLDLYSDLVENLQTPPIWKAIETDMSSLALRQASTHESFNLNEQMYYSVPWWQQEISDEFEFKPKNPGHGSRLYLYNPERSYRNPEWFPPDEFYHGSSGLKNVKTAFANIVRARAKKKNTSSKQSIEESREKRSANFTKIQRTRSSNKGFISWNELSNVTRDYPGHSLVLQSFNQALTLLNDNRELLDRLVVELLYCEVLRKPDIEQLLHQFELKKRENQKHNNFVFEDELRIVEFSWGKNSRKPLPKWINFASVNQETTKKP